MWIFFRKDLSPVQEYVIKKDSLECTITHYSGSKLVKPIRKKRIIAEYGWDSYTYLDDILKERRGIAYLRALFNTKDGAEEIKNTLERLSGKDGGSIIVWTPNRGGRENFPDRMATLRISGGFLIGNCDLYSKGYARILIKKQSEQKKSRFSEIRGCPHASGW